MPARRIVGFGLINKDCVAVVPQWERDGKFAATRYFEQIGGPVPVALTAIARLGYEGPIDFLGVAGDDREAEELERWLQEQGVTPHLRRAPGAATSRSLVLLDARDGSRTVANYAEALPAMAFAEEHRALLADAGLLHLDGRDLPAAGEAADQVRARGGTVSFDLGTMRPGREALIARSDIVLASRGGGAGAFPEAADDPLEQTRRFLALGARIAGVTQAERGVAIAGPDAAPTLLSAFVAPRVVDTCGAGDTFHGAFLWAHLRGDDPRAAADFAQAAVALRIGVYGNRAGLPVREAVDAFLASGPARRGPS